MFGRISLLFLPSSCGCLLLSLIRVHAMVFHFIATSNITQWSVSLLRLHVAKWMLFSYGLYYPYPILLAQQRRRNSKRHPPLIRKEIDLPL